MKQLRNMSARMIGEFGRGAQEFPEAIGGVELFGDCTELMVGPSSRMTVDRDASSSATYRSSMMDESRLLGGTVCGE